MPRISEFYGIAIYMYYRDHAPPHFHAIYGEHEATVNIDTLAIEEGWLPRRAKRLVLEWAALHQEELTNNWIRATNANPLTPIPPLD
jgi:hypothetical protein